MKKAIAAGFLLSLGFAASAADPPEAAISNGVIRARVYLPDAKDGYYRGTRFDWSGAISGLEYKGHTYFGQWFPRYDPKLHDSIAGPVEEFRTGDSALNYAEAKPGDTFVKIGVGVWKREGLTEKAVWHVVREYAPLSECNKLASLGFGMAGSRRFQRPP